MPADRSSPPPSLEPAYVVCGPEAFLRREAVRTIADQVLADADRSLALSEFDASTTVPEPAEVLDDVRTLPFLAPRRLVIVRGADDFISRYRLELEKYLEKPCSTGVLLLECRTLPANTRLYKRVQAIGQVIKCEEIKGSAIPSWLTSRCQQAYGVRLDPRAAAMLFDLVGGDLGLLDGELAKLSLYVGGRGQITAADVEAAVGQHREEQVWEIMSAVAVGDEARALGRWEQVWQTDRAAPGRAIAGIAFTVRRLLAAKRAQEAGTPLRELAAMLMRWRDEEGVQAELAAFSTPQLERMLCKLLDADVAAKTGGASVQSSIEAFIVEACRTARFAATRRGARTRMSGGPGHETSTDAPVAGVRGWTGSDRL